MDRLENAVVAALAFAAAGLVAPPAGAGQAPVQVVQAAAESAVITKGTTSSLRPVHRRPTHHAARSVARHAASRPLPALTLQSSTDEPPAEIGPPMALAIGKSTLIRLQAPIERISVGNPSVADVTLISARELYLLGKSFGSTNVMMWRKGAPTTIIDVNVSMDATALEQQLRQLLPAEKGIVVHTAADSIVLSGTVSSALKADYAVSIAEAFARSYSREFTLPITAGNALAPAGQQIQVGQATAQQNVGGNLQSLPRVINLMRVAQPQQVMLEVKVAEVSKTLLDQLGVGIDAARVSGDWRYSILSSFLSPGAAGLLGATSRTGNSINLNAEKDDGLIRILAEPNIMAISGQEASFLAGGKIFIPVSQAGGVAGGVGPITLEEREYGVGIKFTPTVLDGGRINLKVAPEVSELNQTGTPFTSVNGATAVLPSFTTRRAQTTVQLMDGQSFAIAGLIKNNVTETMKRFPGLGDLPILGTLFRSSQFQTDRSELMFVITPRLIKPLPANYTLPTDHFVPPNRTEFFLKGQLEGSGHPDVPPTDSQLQQAQQMPGAPSATSQGSAAPASSGAAAPAAPPSGGFQLK